MKKKRRDFIKASTLAGIGIASGLNKTFASFNNQNIPSTLNNQFTEQQTSIIGLYGPWAVGLHAGHLPSLSFRRKEFTDLNSWKQKAKTRMLLS